jgi:hypothetical protein
MVKCIAILLLGVLALGVVGCHASGHADDTGVGANISPNH